ncbi:MAG: 1-acyl-sn-glycerol-3-phosphate acyltransferase [Deltaproteobacteria bacterium]|nr:1-acyl-sn-glycerol-3-phosphate acyltransferase [Deltaproteobacteria bacterium]
MRPEDQERILTELESRVSLAKVRATEAGGPKLSEILEDSHYFERKRLKEDRGSPTREADVKFWDQVQQDLRRASERDQKLLARKVIRHYAEEIAGNFDERVYQVVTRALPPGLGLLLNAASPLRLVKRLPQMPNLDESVVIQGEVEQLHRLHEKGTVILVPTHVSNLDSIIVGYALFRMGLPPFIYGAGLNLFTNPLISFFMHNLGAYTVDRKKTDPLYKDVLKEYATLTLEFGYDNIFFPGGTRSRSGAIEQHLKLGLMGTGLAAYINNLQRGAAQPKVFIVPATLSFELVLEAETLIDDFLKEVGKARYIIDDDEFTRPKRVFDFMSQLVSMDSKIHVTVSRGYDVFGNPVDDEGNSLDPCGRVVDTSRYVLDKGKPVHDAARDAEYTREVGERVGEAFLRDNVVTSTHVVAHAIMNLLRERNPRMSVLRILRTGGTEDDLELRSVYRETDRLLGELRALEQRGRIRLGTSLRASAEDVVSDALAHYALYHTRPAAQRRGDRVVPRDRNLVLYYQNRLEGYGLSSRPCLSPNHRALADLRG